jgi:hypothetical protein
MQNLFIQGKLVNARQLLELLFDPQCRPSLRWLRSQTKRKSIPFIRVGRLVFFDVDMVRAALSARNLIRSRAANSQGLRNAA